MFIQIKTDLDELKEVLNQYEVDLPYLTKRILGKIGVSSKKSIRSSYSSYYRKRTGRLYKATMYSLRKSGNSVVIYSPATSDGTKKGVRYGFVLAAGATISAKSNNYMTFMNERGEWKKVKSITLSAKSWVESPIEKYLASSTFEDDKELILQKQLDKYFEKV